MNKVLITAGALAIIAWGLTGCETTKGAGQDIQNTGENIQEGLNASTSETGNMTNETMNQTENATDMGAGATDNTTMDGGIGDANGTGGADTGVGSGSTGGITGY